jgi:hypothetical protein
MTTKNTNCLEGIRCPKCGHEDDFLIRCEVTCLVTDESADAADNCGGYEWDENSGTTCRDCGHQDILDEFMIENQKPTTEGE